MKYLLSFFVIIFVLLFVIMFYSIKNENEFTKTHYCPDGLELVRLKQGPMACIVKPLKKEK